MESLVEGKRNSKNCLNSFEFYVHSDALFYLISVAYRTMIYFLFKSRYFFFITLSYLLCALIRAYRTYLVD